MKGDENGWKTAKLKQKRRENVDEEQKELNYFVAIYYIDF